MTWRAGAPVPSALVVALLVVATLLSPWSAMAAPQAPATMVFVGEIRPRELPPAAQPQQGDALLIFGLADGQLAGTGQVAANGAFLAVATRTQSFNGQEIVFELQQGRRRYSLTWENGAPATLRFSGQMLPERTSLALHIGMQTAELSETEAATPGAQRLSLRTDLPCDAQADINEDGRCDESDWRILRLYGGGISLTVGKP